MVRTPLIAGNWKLNLDHLEATHAVQKLAWLLRDGKHDFSAVEVAVLPAFTSIRTTAGPTRSTASMTARE